MERVLILDTETQGLNPDSDRVIEVAAILYSVRYSTVLRCFSSLIAAPSNAAEEINRIPAAALPGAPPADAVWAEVLALAEQADAIVAHRAEFDRSFSPPALQTLRPWVCSKFDIRWPKQTKDGPSLVALALEHDLGVAYAHRALADCDLIARLFTRSRELGADLDAMLARAMRPRATFVALVSYDDREKAKQAGFQWDGGKREWRRRLAIEDAAALPFKVRQVEAAAR